MIVLGGHCDLPDFTLCWCEWVHAQHRSREDPGLKPPGGPRYGQGSGQGLARGCKG